MKKYISLFIFAMLLGACSRDLDTNMPKVQTNGIMSVTDTSFECGGTVISDGGFNITSRGICWSTTDVPTAVEGFKTEDGVGVGVFMSKVVGLDPVTRYYYRAYATNSEGTGYGEVFTFVTKKSVFAPTVTTNLITSIELITAECGGVVTANGGDSVVRCGVCWSTSPNPTTSLTTKVVQNYTTNEFTCSLTALNYSTTYYVRAYAVNTKGVSYGDNQMFTTKVLPSIALVSVTGGTFQMGSYNGLSNEQPVHTVTVNNFKIGKTEVTIEMWNAVMQNSLYRPEQIDLPANNISMNMAMEFVTRLSLATQKNYRLPTEAEWEYAAGEGSGSRTFYAAGVNDTVDFAERAWYSSNANGDTHPVGMLLPNKLGIFDMGGNVSEWCKDWYGEYSSETIVNPKGPQTGNQKVLRGGSFSDDAAGCRTSIRQSLNPASFNRTTGFRIALNE